MRVVAIVRKVILELLRDKRTVVLMFVAPIFIMFLMNIMFSAESQVDVRLGAVGVDPHLVSTLDKAKHIDVSDFSSEEKGQAALKNGQLDTLIVSSKADGFNVTYANQDVSKTQVSRQILKSSLMLNKSQDMKELLNRLLVANPKLAMTVNPKKDNTSIKEKYFYGDKDTGFFAKMMPVLIGFLTFFFVFLISGMALLKERTSGTLDRLLATPVRRAQIVLGYMIAYGLLAMIQTSIIVTSAIYLLHLQVLGNIFHIILVSEVLALVALAFGILLSTLAKSEFQMMQFIPLVVLPQLFFSGLIPLDSMASWVRTLGKFLPLSYSGHAISAVVFEGKGLDAITKDIGILLIFLVVLTVANVIGLKRYRKV